MTKASSIREGLVRVWPQCLFRVDLSLRLSSLISATAPGILPPRLAHVLLMGLSVASLLVPSRGARAQGGTAPLARPETRSPWSTRPLRS